MSESQVMYYQLGDFVNAQTTAGNREVVDFGKILLLAGTLVTSADVQSYYTNPAAYQPHYELWRSEPFFGVTPENVALFDEFVGKLASLGAQQD